MCVEEACLEAVNILCDAIEHKYQTLLIHQEEEEDEKREDTAARFWQFVQQLQTPDWSHFKERKKEGQKKEKEANLFAHGEHDANHNIHKTKKKTTNKEKKRIQKTRQNKNQRITQERKTNKESDDSLDAHKRKCVDFRRKGRNSNTLCYIHHLRQNHDTE